MTKKVRLEVADLSTRRMQQLFYQLTSMEDYFDWYSMPKKKVRFEKGKLKGLGRLWWRSDEDQPEIED